MKTRSVKNIKSNGKSLLRGQLGYNLIEVMVAAMILSTAILGIAGLQMIGMKGTQQSLMKQQAMGVVQNMIERMRSNQVGVTNGFYEFTSDSVDCGQALPNCTLGCSSAQVALVDRLNLVCGTQFGGSVKTGGVRVTSSDDNASLVNGSLDVVCVDCALGDLTITVGWTEREFGEETGGVNETLVINTRVVTKP